LTWNVGSSLGSVSSPSVQRWRYAAPETANTNALYRVHPLLVFRNFSGFIGDTITVSSEYFGSFCSTVKKLRITGIVCTGRIYSKVDILTVAIHASGVL